MVQIQRGDGMITTGAREASKFNFNSETYKCQQ